jgi:hypothetical protein
MGVKGWSTVEGSSLYLSDALRLPKYYCCLAYPTGVVQQCNLCCLLHRLSPFYATKMFTIHDPLLLVFISEAALLPHFLAPTNKTL